MDGENLWERQRGGCGEKMKERGGIGDRGENERLMDLDRGFVGVLGRCAVWFFVREMSEE